MLGLWYNAQCLGGNGGVLFFAADHNPIVYGQSALCETISVLLHLGNGGNSHGGRCVMWARNYERCERCGTDTIPHNAKGLCRKCYNFVYGKEQKRRYRDRNRESERERWRRYYRKNREHRWAYVRAWVKDNPERVKEANRERCRRRRRKYPETAEYIANRKHLSETVPFCTNCGATERLEVHHIVPAEVGGTHALDNLQILCFKCHRTEHGCDMSHLD